MVRKEGEISATKNTFGIQVEVKVSLFLSQRGAHVSCLARFYTTHFGDVKQLSKYSLVLPLE